MPEMKRRMPQPNSQPPIASAAADGSPQEALDLGEPESLPVTIERPVDQTPDPIEQAAELVVRGEMSAAMTTLRAYVAREPNNGRARAALASMLEKRGDVEGALGELGRALESSPDDVSILCARAAMLGMRGRYDQAEEDLRRAARINDRNADVHVQLGMLFSKRARWREAIEPLLVAIGIDAGRADAHYHLGEAYNHIDNLPAALASYEAASSMEPMNMRALKGIGIVLDRLGRPVEAAAAYRRAREAQRK